MTPVENSLSRREWLERMAGPALVSTLGAGVLTMPSALAQPATAAATEDRLRGARVYNIRDFGATGDGTTSDTAAVQTAIDTCSRDQGGTVLVPAGDFVIGTIDLKSHITLHLATNGRLLGSPRKEDYRAGKDIPRSNGNVVLLGAAGIENLTIEGNGTIDGNGLKFWTGQGDNTGPGQNSQQGYFERPHLLVFSHCKNVRMRDVFLTASAYHCTRILDCERVWLDGVRIFNRVNKNNDGFHFNNCQYVHVMNCDVKCQDDACALFGGNKWVTIANCTFSTRWSIFRFGAGEAENITITNCVIYDTYGSVIKMAGRAGSRYENITFSNLIMKNVTGPITVGLNSIRRNPPATAAGVAGVTGGASGAAVAAPAPATPPVMGVVRNISFNNIRAYVVAEGRQFPDMHWEQGYRDGERRTCLTLNGVGDEYLENISLTDVHVVYEGGGTAEEAALRDLPLVAGEYFELGPRPAYGLYVRGVRGLSLHNVRFEVQKPDLRPAVVFDNVQDAAVNGLSAQGNAQAESVLRMIRSRDVLMTATRVLTPAAVLLRVEGAASENIIVDGGDVAKAARTVEFAGGAAEKSARVRV